MDTKPKIYINLDTNKWTYDAGSYPEWNKRAWIWCCEAIVRDKR